MPDSIALRALKHEIRILKAEKKFLIKGIQAVQGKIDVAIEKRNV